MPAEVGRNTPRNTIAARLAAEKRCRIGAFHRPPTKEWPSMLRLPYQAKEREREATRAT
jgi:hypothetical protein